MDSKYAYSLDGTNWKGAYASRKEARTAAMAAAHELEEVPGVVFVARVRPVDPQASGHAQNVLREMNRRFRDLGGDVNYLSNVTVQQRRELDAQLEQAIAGWLIQHHLLPQGQRIEAISEYPVPPAPLHPAREAAEVGTVGETPLV
jgi:septal ring-binding cell division protein DamX